MDTSKQYIEMCDCPEIQEPKRSAGLVHGDYISPTQRPDQWDIVYDPSKALRYGLLECVWLPRQDQLQEMVGYKGLPYLLTQTFERSVNGESCNYTWNNGEHFTSMEQLWLAFVMKEKYDKVWNGKWVDRV
ncbi:hypothetical protein LCGC14_3042760 [marine sediment metagenome]|uniref:Uncharacterized protein n=1 Tax=marine sediment metagenome TaxID=412755 RepID=A0A0F8ZF06_9ZZZZ